MLRLLFSLLVLVPDFALSQTIVATRTMRSQTIIAPMDVAISDLDVTGTLQALSDAIGMETRQVIYAGRPIRPGDIGPPAIIKRNQIVTVYFERASLTIMADARALDRAGAGDLVRVMNIASRNIVTGTVHPDGSVRVGGSVSLARN